MQCAFAVFVGLIESPWSLGVALSLNSIPITLSVTALDLMRFQFDIFHRPSLFPLHLLFLCGQQIEWPSRCRFLCAHILVYFTASLSSFYVQECTTTHRVVYSLHSLFGFGLLFISYFKRRSIGGGHWNSAIMSHPEARTGAEIDTINVLRNVLLLCRQSHGSISGPPPSRVPSASFLFCYVVHY